MLYISNTAHSQLNCINVCADVKPGNTKSAKPGDISTTSTDTSNKEDTKLSETADKSNPEAVAKTESVDADAKIDPTKSAASGTNTKEEAKAVSTAKQAENSPQKTFKVHTHARANALTHTSCICIIYDW